MRARFRQTTKSICGGGVITIAEQDQTIRSITQLEIGVPVFALLLKRDEHIEAATSSGSCVMRASTTS